MALTSAGSFAPLLQRHDIDAAAFEHRAFGEVDLVELQFGNALGDRHNPDRAEKLERTR